MNSKSSQVDRPPSHQNDSGGPHLDQRIGTLAEVLKDRLSDVVTQEIDRIVTQLPSESFPLETIYLYEKQIKSTELSESADVQLDTQLTQLAVMLDTVQEPVVELLQHTLRQFEGIDFPSAESRKVVAQQIQMILERTRYRIRCPKTGLPVVLRCKQAGGAKSGTFEFRVKLKDGRYTCKYSSTKLPAFQLMKMTPPNSGRK